MYGWTCHVNGFSGDHERQALFTLNLSALKAVNHSFDIPSFSRWTNFRQLRVLVCLICSAKHTYQLLYYIRKRKYNFAVADVATASLIVEVKLSRTVLKFRLLRCSPLAVTPHYIAQLAELQFLRMKGNKSLKPNSTRVCLSAIVDIFICPMSKAETRWEIRTSRAKLTVRSQTVKSSAPTAFNTQMDCHIRFRGIGYYTLGLLFPTQPSARQDWVWALSCFILLACEFFHKDNKYV